LLPTFLCRLAPATQDPAPAQGKKMTLRKTWLCRLLALFGLIIFAASSALATGCSGSQSDAIVTVGSHAISRATLEHWMPVVAIRDYELLPKTPIPAWVVTKPPDFDAGVSHLASASSSVTHISTTAELRRKCRQQYQSVRAQTLNFLITGQWLIAEGEDQGLTATDGEVRARFHDLVIANEFGSTAAFVKYQRLTGESFSDQLFRSRVKVMSEKLEAKLKHSAGSTPQERERVFIEWADGLATKWAARTRCHAGYVVSNCSEYKGSAKPQITL
jgi:hypothetical protein